jgi:hypothetical protein
VTALERYPIQELSSEAGTAADAAWSSYHSFTPFLNSYEYVDYKYQCSRSGDVSFCTDPDPSISEKKSKKNLDFSSFATS